MSTQGKTYTHSLQYQQRDGSWSDGHLAYTLAEAKGVAREGRKRTERAVRIVPLKASYVVAHERES